MQFTVEKNELKDALAHVIGIVPSKSTLDVVQGVLLAAAPGCLTIKANSLDAEATTSAPADVKTNGAIIVNARLLSEVSKKAASDEITFSLEGHVLKVRAGRFRSDMPTAAADAFPYFGDVNYRHRFEIEGKALKRLLDKTRFIPLSDDARPFTTCVYLHSTGAHLRAVATDGHRLARVHTECGASAGMPGIMIPQKIIGEICKLIDVAEPIEVSVSANDVRFVVGCTTIVSKLVGGTFPDYEALLKRHEPISSVLGQPKTIIVDSNDMARAVDRVAMFADQFKVKFSFSAANIGISTVVKSSSSGAAEEDCSCELDGDPIDIGFNYKYVLSLLEELDGEVKFQFNGSDKPAALISSLTDDSALYLLMPLIN